MYVQSDTLLLADVFENFRNKCIEINELYAAHFFSAPGLAWQACLKKTEVRLELLIDIDMLLMVEKGIRGGICHAIHSYAEANKYMKNYDQNKESSYIQYLDANNDEDRNKGHILEVDVEYPKNFHDLHSNLPFLPKKKKKINKRSQLVCSLYDKNNYVVDIRALKQALNHGLM